MKSTLRKNSIYGFFCSCLTYYNFSIMFRLHKNISNNLLFNTSSSRNFKYVFTEQEWTQVTSISLINITTVMICWVEFLSTKLCLLTLNLQSPTAIIIIYSTFLLISEKKVMQKPKQYMRNRNILEKKKLASNDAHI